VSYRQQAGNNSVIARGLLVEMVALSLQ